MNFFALLRHRAAAMPMSIASRSSRRIVTYRKFWSRIERGTARLKAEWGIAPGDTVAYWGQGHQDALVLYIATARCGARLLPLEHAACRAHGAALLERHAAAILLHDDDVTCDAASVVPRIVNLSSLIATRCHHVPEIEEDAACVSMILPMDTGEKAYSLQQLTADIAVHDVPGTFHIDAALFDEDIFAPRVLSLLGAGGTIIFK